ncbi:MAG: hypothetical protein AAF409_01070 [Pseudomonadota bacterium]
MKETPTTLVAVGIGAFFAGIAFGYGIQQWSISLNEEALLERGRVEGRAEERQRLGVAETSNGCTPNGEVFELEVGGAQSHCQTGATLVLSRIAADGYLRGTLAGKVISTRPPKLVPFGSADGENCTLTVGAVKQSDPLRAVFSFGCN